MNEESFPGFAELLRLLGKGKADSKWYVDYISTLTNGTHVIFKPDYFYVKASPQGDLEIINRNGFFDCLPESKDKGNGNILLSDSQK